MAVVIFTGTTELILAVKTLHKFEKITKTNILGLIIEFDNEGLSQGNWPTP